MGTYLRCIAPHEVAVRADPKFSSRVLGKVQSGDSVYVLEEHGNMQWIREAGGWLPIVDPRGVKLFEIEPEPIKASLDDYEFFDLPLGQRR